MKIRVLDTHMEQENDYSTQSIEHNNYLYVITFFIKHRKLCCTVIAQSLAVLVFSYSKSQSNIMWTFILHALGGAYETQNMKRLSLYIQITQHSSLVTVDSQKSILVNWEYLTRLRWNQSHFKQFPDTTIFHCNVYFIHPLTLHWLTWQE